MYLISNSFKNDLKSARIIFSIVKSSKAKSLSCYILSAAVSVLLNTNTVQAQDADTEKYKAFTAGAHIKNMHLWHGSVVHPGAVFATTLEFNSKNQKLTLGLWGGAGFSGTDVTNKETGESVSANYKEFSIYALYHFSDKLFLEAVSHNNYTGVEERGDVLHYWSYDKTQGYNFVDINLGYNITPKTLLYLATIVGGGSGDYEIQDDGSYKDSWTHYFEVKSKVWQKNSSSLSLFAGGAWSFFTDKTFYTQKSGNIINTGITYSESINIGNHKLPIEVTAMWNPEQEKTALQLDIMLF